jgi:hypothetical protein
VVGANFKELQTSGKHVVAGFRACPSNQFLGPVSSE